MQKGIDYKNNVTLQKEKYEQIMEREFKIIREKDSYYWHDNVYEQIHREFSYNLPQHEWVLIGFGEELNMKTTGDNLKFYKEFSE